MAIGRDEARNLLYGAGFSKTAMDTETMVDIMYAESSGNPNAHNSKPPDDSYGLWQINMIGSLGPARRKQFGITTNDALYDPATNAKAAHIVYKGSGLKAWSTYNNNEYLKHTNEGGGGAVADTTAAAGNQFSGVTSGLAAVASNLFKGIENVGYLLLAIALLIGGVVLLVLNTDSGKKAVKTVGKVV